MPSRPLGWKFKLLRTSPRQHFASVPEKSAAISLAQEIGAKLVLIDERQGAKIARAQGLLATGTLGVLQAAANRQLISLADALAALEQTNFHRSPTLFADLLRQHDSNS